MQPGPLPPGERLDDELGEGDAIAALDAALQERLKHPPFREKLTLSRIDAWKAGRTVIVEARFRRKPQNTVTITLPTAYARLLLAKLKAVLE